MGLFDGIGSMKKGGGTPGVFLTLGDYIITIDRVFEHKTFKTKDTLIVLTGEVTRVVQPMEPVHGLAGSHTAGTLVKEHFNMTADPYKYNLIDLAQFVRATMPAAVLGDYLAADQLAELQAASEDPQQDEVETLLHMMKAGDGDLLRGAQVRVRCTPKQTDKGSWIVVNDFYTPED